MLQKIFLLEAYEGHVPQNPISGDATVAIMYSDDDRRLQLAAIV
jgi:hypothetical protein